MTYPTCFKHETPLTRGDYSYYCQKCEETPAKPEGAGGNREIAEKITGSFLHDAVARGNQTELVNSIERALDEKDKQIAALERELAEQNLVKAEAAELRGALEEENRKIKRMLLESPRNNDFDAGWIAHRVAGDYVPRRDLEEAQRALSEAERRAWAYREVADMYWPDKDLSAIDERVEKILANNPAPASEIVKGKP